MSDTTSVQVQFGASLTDLESGTQAAASTVQAATQEISAASTEMAATTEAANAKVVVSTEEMSEESAGFLSELREQVLATGESFEAMTKGVQGITAVGTAISEFIAVGLGMEAVADVIKETAENGEQLLKLSQVTGISTQALSGLQVAAKESGTDFETFTRSLQRLPQVLQQAVKSPSSTASEALTAMGGSGYAASLQMMPLGDALDSLSQKLAGYADGGQKTALVTELFGRGAAQLIPMLNQLAGDGGIAGVTAKAQQYGVAVSQDAAEADEKFMKGNADLGIQMEGFKETIGDAVIPALNVLIDSLNSNSGGMSVMQAVAIVLADSLKVIIEVVTACATGFNELMDVLEGVGGELAALITGAEALAQAFAGNFHAAYEDVVQAGQMMTSSWNDALSKMANQEKIFADTHNALWNSVDTSVPAAEEAPLPEAPTIQDTQSDKKSDEAAKKAAEAAQKAQQVITTSAADAAQAQDNLAKTTYQTQVEQWDAEVSAGQITKEQETQLEIDAANTQYQTQMDALNKKLALYKQGTVAYRQTLDEEAQLTASHNDQIAKLNAQMQSQIAAQNAKAVKDATTEWEAGLQPIDQAFTQTINGIIQGTNTLQEGMDKAIQSILEKYIEVCAKMLTQWLATEAAKLTATRITQAGVTASAQTGQEEQATMNIKTITQAAATAAANAYAATAGIPYIGPVLAPVAAAAAFAGVMAFDVISAAGGAESIPADGTMAILHEQEMVLPASIANPLRANLASSSTNSSNNSGGNSTSLTFAPQISMGGNSSTADLNTVLQQSSTQMYNWVVQNYGRNGALTLPGR